MTYIAKLRKKSILGKALYAHERFFMFAMVLSLVIAVVFAGISVYVYCGDIGYAAFKNTMAADCRADIKVDRLCKIVKDAVNNKTFCMYFSGDEHGIVLVPDSDLEGKLKSITDRPSYSSADAPVHIKGLSCELNTDFDRFIKNNELLSRFCSSYGTAYLDAGVKVYPPAFVPLLCMCALFFLIFTGIYIFLLCKDARYMKGITNIENFNRKASLQLESELKSLGNLAISESIVVTDNFYLDSGKVDFFPLDTILWLYIEENEALRKLIAYTNDGKKHVIAVGKTNQRTCRACVLFDDITKNHKIPLIGYDKNTRESYKDMRNRIEILNGINSKLTFDEKIKEGHATRIKR